MRKLKEEFGCETKIFTYLQGVSVAQKNGFECELLDEKFEKETVTSIGINPMSVLGSKVVMSVINENHDLVIMDGEPLLTHALSLSFDKSKIVSLLNPYDVVNPFLPISSINYFRYCLMSAGTSIVHGFWKMEKPVGYDGEYHSIGTILRKSILDIKKAEQKTKDIVCILGGGTQNASTGFFNTTVEIGSKVMQVANKMSDRRFRIYANDPQIKAELEKDGIGNNVIIYDTFVSPQEVYENAGVVICRAGRNSTSELLYLKIPAIIVATGNDFRAKEQQANIEKVCKLSGGQIHKLAYQDDVDCYIQKINDMIDAEDFHNEFTPGNESLLEILTCKMESLH